MTATALDAQIQGRDPQGWANQLTQIIRDALTRAHQERQPTFLRDRSFLSVEIILLSPTFRNAHPYLDQNCSP